MLKPIVQFLADSVDPFSGVNVTTTVEADNPLLMFFKPVLQILFLVVLGAMVWFIVKHYISGQRSKMIIEIVFGIICIVFAYDPTIIGSIIKWALKFIHK